jgi:hypothetical protein
MRGDDLGAALAQDAEVTAVAAVAGGSLAT